MKNRILLLSLVLALLFGLAGPPFGNSGAHADSDKDHDKARRELAKKEILPLDQVLAKVHAQVPGDIIDVEFEEEDNIWIYEFKIIEPAGKVVKIVADAKTGEILKTKRK
jgi:uncharacterized membrane protein YkoI